jgi:hypothetical protein
MANSEVRSQTNVESRYFLSFSVDLDVLVVISKLIFPSDGLSSAKLPEDSDLRFTAHVYCHGEPIHHVSISTSSCPRQLASSLIWDEVITFPVKVSAS